jgi:hypothetical protein
LFLGKSTPAILATARPPLPLSLTLFVTLVDADDAHNPLAADYFAFTADFFDRRSDFHGFESLFRIGIAQDPGQ